MPAYRFCRPDDVPYLVGAINECGAFREPGEPPMTVERFRREMKELDVWPSNSMVAREGDEPVAVLIGTKREAEVLVWRIGVKPGRQGEGHGRHLLRSLSKKLAVLGPPRLVAELPEALGGASAFFEACDYRDEGTFEDWLGGPSVAGSVPDELVVTVSLDEVLDAAGPDLATGVCWQRQLATLTNRAAELRGSAIVSPERLEAYLFSRQARGEEEVVAFGGSAGGDREALLGLLLRALAARSGRRVRLRELAPGELRETWLQDLGFRRAGGVRRYATEAVAG